MILLDTNVISEAMKAQPSAEVLRWLDAQASETLFISSITLAELLYGIGVLSDGKRKAHLAEIVEGITHLFEGRILAFTAEAARHYAHLAVRARASGKGFPTPDGYIAAIATAHGFAIATRDTSPFAAAGLPVIVPWQMGSEA